MDTICQLMAVAAITAPKTKGEDFVEVLAVIRRKPAHRSARR